MISVSLCYRPLLPPNLRTLAIISCSLSVLPDNFGDVLGKSLKTLYLNGNHLKKLPKSFAKCTLLEGVCLNNNWLESLGDEELVVDEVGAGGPWPKNYAVDHAVVEGEGHEEDHVTGGADVVSTSSTGGASAARRPPGSCFEGMKNLRVLDFCDNKLRRFPDLKACGALVELRCYGRISGFLRQQADPVSGSQSVWGAGGASLLR